MSCLSEYLGAYCRYHNGYVVTLELPNQLPFRDNLTERENDHSDKGNPCGNIEQGPAMS